MIFNYRTELYVRGDHKGVKKKKEKRQRRTISSYKQYDPRPNWLSTVSLTLGELDAQLWGVLLGEHGCSCLQYCKKKKIKKIPDADRSQFE